MESTFKDVRDGAVSSSSVIDVDSKSTVAPGGPHDVYGEDAATEEQVVTPWFVSVAR
jgi:malate dehydrogenase (oxaloacetate-decarboxylating)(NADP+)